MLPQGHPPDDAAKILFDNGPLLWTFIAGPYTKPDPETNVANAIDAATRVAASGVALPIVPLLVHAWDERNPHTYEFWIEYTKHLLSGCDLLLRLPGESKGADDEVKLAIELGIKVFFDENALLTYAYAAGAGS